MADTGWRFDVVRYHAVAASLARFSVICAIVGACGVRPSVPLPQRPVPADSPFAVVASAIVPAIIEPRARRFGGISGLVYDPQRDEWLAVSDDHFAPRWFICRIEASNGRLHIRGRRLVVARPPTHEQGQPRFFDFEAAALLPGGDLLISSEGNVEGGRRHPASLLRFHRDGSYSGDVRLPDKFLPAVAGAPARGLRDNRGFEGMALSPDGSRVWAIAEAPLQQDDDLPGEQRGARARLLEFVIERDRLRASRELVYPIDRVTAPAGDDPATGVVDQGVSDMTVLPDGSLLTMERAFLRDSRTRRTVNVIRLFRIRLDDAEDVSNVYSLRDVPNARQVSKALVLDLSTAARSLPARLARLENFEAMAPGPPVSGGRSLVLMSDDNFNATQVTAAVLLRY